VNRLHPLWGPVVDYLARVIEIPRNVKQGVMLGLDMVFVTVSMVVAYGYPFTPGSRLPGAVELFCAAITLAATALIFLRMGLYRAIIRFMGQQAIWAFIQAVSYSTLVTGRRHVFHPGRCAAQHALRVLGRGHVLHRRYAPRGARQLPGAAALQHQERTHLRCR
jgi:uncharacterized membrane protein YhdT